MKLIFASSNPNKLKEIREILKGYNIISLLDLSDNDEVEEVGSTFEENAYLKAKYYYDKYKLPTFADDSGLVVPALGGAPGVMSARYSGVNANSLNNNLKLLNELKGKENHDAYFITVICFIDDMGNAHYFEGRIDGQIIDEFRGNDGFGYDPIFYLPERNKTFAELGNEKNSISHRFRALTKFNDFLKKDGLLWKKK